MRLLNTHNWAMTEFISDDQVPPYAILSHTWEEEEIDFQHWENREFVDIGQTKGYRKIKQFGERAANNGYDWVWVDTYAYPSPYCSTYSTNEMQQAAASIRKVAPS
jgi:hypothetical protein